MNMTDTIKEMFGGDVKVQGLHALFMDTLKDIYHGEKQILKALPKMAKKATSEDLRMAFEKHEAQTEKQVERLEQVFELMGASARGKTCEAIQGLITEAEEVISETEGEVRDAGMVAAAQAVEHYEMARYGTLVAWAREMGHTEAVKLLEQNLKEEEQTDALLTRMAEKSINRDAADVMDEADMGGGRSREGGRSHASRH